MPKAEKSVNQVDIVEEKANVSQNGDSQQLQAIPAVKRRYSTKSPVVKAQVISKRTQGESISKIAKNLGITRNTARVILSEANFDQEIESGRIGCVKLIPQALRVAEHRLSQNSENMAIKVLENTIWPLNQKQGKAGDPGLVLAIQNLMGNITVQSTENKQVKPVSEAIDVPSSGSPSPLTLIETKPQVVENKENAS